jgi:rubrerythrin
MRATPSTLDVLLTSVHRWVWSDVDRRAHKLLTFGQTEEDGAHDISRAAELTPDPSLRLLYLRHAADEQRHAVLFRKRGREILDSSRPPVFEANWLAPGERGLDDLDVGSESDQTLLAFLHLSEKAAAGRFVVYQKVLACDPQTRAVFARILKDEEFHMTYTRKQLARLAQRNEGWRLWQARAGRLWNAYLRVASAVASVLGTAMLAFQYFVILPVFALFARRAAIREAEGFVPSRAQVLLGSQY